MASVGDSLGTTMKEPRVRFACQGLCQGLFQWRKELNKAQYFHLLSFFWYNGSSISASAAIWPWLIKNFYAGGFLHTDDVCTFASNAD